MTHLSVYIGDEDLRLKLPGQKVYGHVDLCATSVLSGTRIEATLVGEEKSHVDKVEHGGDQKWSFLRLSIPLGSQAVISNGKINPGTYRMPFEFTLPVKLPSPMNVKTDNPVCNCTAEIKYYILVKILGSGILFDYFATTDLQVIAETFHPEKPIPFYGKSLEQQVNVCCCHNLGHVTIGARVKNTLLSKSDVVDVCISVCNNSKAPVIRMYAEIVECIRWQAQGHHTEVSRSLSLVKIPLFPGCVPRMPHQRLSPSQVDSVIRRALKRGDHIVRLSVPDTAHNDFKGELIECVHMIRICLEMGGFWSASPRLEFAVQTGPYPQSEVDQAASITTVKPTP